MMVKYLKKYSSDFDVVIAKYHDLGNLSLNP
jgi:hypothetical protein